MSLPSLKLYHRETYPAISPTLPQLSQSGKTVIVSRGSSGIGFAIARSFVTAGAARVIILGRRREVVESAATTLNHEAGRDVAEGRTVDVYSLPAIEALWSTLHAQGIYVHALFLLNVSTITAYMWTTIGADRPTYGLTKNAALALVQQIAKDSNPNELRIVSFHPGGILTESARKEGYADSGFHFDNGTLANNLSTAFPYVKCSLNPRRLPENLPGHFAVWAASPEATFLHGRFVWANWDVLEMKEDIGKRVHEEEHFLKVGVEGLSEKDGGARF